MGTIPFNVIQLLWINLVMDILGAIALGTEPVSEAPKSTIQTKEERISRGNRIMSPSMWRNMIVQITYQVIVILSL